MRALLTVLLVSGMALGQSADAARSVDTAQPSNSPRQTAVAAPTNAAAQVKEQSVAPVVAAPAQAPNPNAVVIPAGTKIPLLLKQAISTKNAREGDAVCRDCVSLCDERPHRDSGRDVCPGKITHTELRGGRRNAPKFQSILRR